MIWQWEVVSVGVIDVSTLSHSGGEVVSHNLVIKIRVPGWEFRVGGGEVD